MAAIHYLPIRRDAQSEHPLTPREAQVIELGRLSAKDTALALGCKEKTVEVHWDRIRKKLGASNKTEAVLIWIGRAA